jgi:hypothetical protein
MKTKFMAVIIAAMFPLGATAGGAGSHSSGSAGAGLNAGAGEQGAGLTESGSAHGMSPGASAHGSANVQGSARSDTRADRRGFFSRTPRDLSASANSQLALNPYQVIVPGDNQADVKD